MTKERMLYIDRLKALAMIMVVMGHTIYCSIAIGKAMKKLRFSLFTLLLFFNTLPTISQTVVSLDEVRQAGEGTKTYFDLQGHRLTHPRGLCIERSADGTSRKVIMKR